MPSYNRLTADNRIELYALNKAGLKQNAIAAQLNVSPSTISRELRRNSGLRGYRPKQADRLACARRSQAQSPIKVRAFVEADNPLQQFLKRKSLELVTTVCSLGGFLHNLAVPQGSITSRHGDQFAVGSVFTNAAFV